MKIEKMFSALNISARALGAQRKRMNAIANNIANAETTRTEEGGPYKRKHVMLQETQQQQFLTGLRSAELKLARTNHDHIPDDLVPFGDQNIAQGTVDAIEKEDPTPFKTIYDPSHPDADENGYVHMPNVNIVTEMVDMIAASRAFEANVTAINATKAMAKDSLEI